MCVRGMWFANDVKVANVDNGETAMMKETNVGCLMVVDG